MASLCESLCTVSPPLLCRPSGRKLAEAVTAALNILGCAHTDYGETQDSLLCNEYVGQG